MGGVGETASPRMGLQPEAAVCEFFTFDGEDPSESGVPTCHEDGLLSGGYQGPWDRFTETGSGVFRLSVPEPWEGLYGGWIDTHVVCRARRQAEYYAKRAILTRRGIRYLGYRSRAVPV